MRQRLLSITVLSGILAAGVLAALTLAPTAFAWDWHGLPSGYMVSSYQTCYDEAAGDGVEHWPNCGSIPVCDHLTIQSSAGTFTEADCVPSFQTDLDHYVDSTICMVNAGAGGQACQPTTTTALTTTTTAATTTTTGTTMAAPPASAPTAGETATVQATTTVTTVAQLVAPVADFSGETVNPDVVTFTDVTQQGSGTVSSRVWQFGDGAAATGSPITHAYPGPGSYYATLIVVDSNGLTSVAVRHVLIAADHTASIGPRQTQAASGARTANSSVRYAGVTAALAVRIARSQLTALEIRVRGVNAAAAAKAQSRRARQQPKVTRSACSGAKAWKVAWPKVKPVWVNQTGIVLSCYTA